MKANFATSTIVLTKAEAKAAAIYGSEMYNELLKYKKDFPDYSVVVREVKSNSKRKSANKGFTYDKMETYVNRHGSDLQKQQFAEMREESKQNGESIYKNYTEIKKWFDSTFPEASNFAAAVARITAVA